MALDTYANLQTAILNRIDMGGDSEMVAAVPDFITVAEAEIVRWAKVVWLEKRDTLTATTAFVDLPADFNGFRAVQLEYQNQRFSVMQVSPDMLDLIEPSNVTDIPQYYAVHAEQVEFRPAPASGTDFDVTYYFKPTVLSDSNTSNEILVNAPDLLFYRSLAEAYDHIQNEGMAAKYMQMYARARDDILKDSARRRWDGNPMRMQADSLRVMY